MYTSRSWFRNWKVKILAIITAVSLIVALVPANQPYASASVPPVNISIIEQVINELTPSERSKVQAAVNNVTAINDVNVVNPLWTQNGSPTVFAQKINGYSAVTKANFLKLLKDTNLLFPVFNINAVLTDPTTSLLLSQLKQASGVSLDGNELSQEDLTLFAINVENQLVNKLVSLGATGVITTLLDSTANVNKPGITAVMQEVYTNVVNAQADDFSKVLFSFGITGKQLYDVRNNFAAIADPTNEAQFALAYSYLRVLAADGMTPQEKAAVNFAINQLRSDNITTGVLDPIWGGTFISKIAGYPALTRANFMKLIKDTGLFFIDLDFEAARNDPNNREFLRQLAQASGVALDVNGLTMDDLETFTRNVEDQVKSEIQSTGALGLIAIALGGREAIKDVIREGFNKVFNQSQQDDLTKVLTALGVTPSQVWQVRNNIASIADPNNEAQMALGLSILRLSVRLDLSATEDNGAKIVPKLYAFNNIEIPAFINSLIQWEFSNPAHFEQDSLGNIKLKSPVAGVTRTTLATARFNDPTGNLMNALLRQDIPITMTYTNPTAPPEPQIIGVVDGLTYASAVSPTWVDPAGTTSDAYLTINGLTTIAYTKGTPISLNGEYELIVQRVSLTSGLTSEKMVIFTIDTLTPPNPVISGVSNGQTYASALAPTWSEVGQSNSSATLSRNGGTAQPYVKGTTISQSGTYVLTVTNTRTTNGLTSSTIVNFTIDNEPPVAPVVTGVTNGATVTTSVAPTWTEVAGTTTSATLKLNTGAPQVFSKGTTISANGNYQLSVTRTKLSNGLTATTIVNFTIGSPPPPPDTTPPTAPVITGVSNGLTSASPVTPTWTEVDGTTSSATLTINGGAPQAFLKGTSISANGVYQLSVTRTKLANGLTATSVIDFTIDSTIPTTPSIIGVTNGVTYATSVSPTWTDPAGTTSTATLTLNGGIAQPFTKLTTISANGAYTLAVTRTNIANGQTSVASVSFTIDTIAPSAPTITGVNNGVTYASAVTPSWSSIAGTTTTATLALNGGPPQAYNLGTPISANGEYLLSVTRTKSANGLTATAAVSFTIDTIAPLAPVVTGVANGITYANAVTPSWTALAGTTTTATLIINGGAPQAYTLGTPISANGNYIISVTRTKSANGLTATTVVNFSIDTIPPAAPTLIGVNNGATYILPVSPTWNDQIGTTTTATVSLNGGAAIPYNSGTTIALSGAYVLNVVRTKTTNGLTATTTINFSMDTAPPLAAVITGVVGGTTYNSTVSPSWPDAVGVTSTATISVNGGAAQAYTRGTPLSVNGTYLLTVISTRTSNGLTATSQVSFTVNVPIPVTPGAVAPIVTALAETALSVSTAVNASGVSVVTVAVDAAALEEAFTSLSEIVVAPTSNAAAPQLVAIQVQKSEGDGAASLALPVSALIAAASKLPNAALAVTFDTVTYQLPLKVINTATLASSLGVAASDVKINISIEVVAGEKAQELASAAGDSGLTLLADAIEFSITAEANGQSTAITDFGNTYVSRSIELKVDIEPDAASGVLFDPDTGVYTFVPATFDEVDGKLIATLKRNGNSIYTVVSAEKKEFKDLTLKNKSAHWAKNDIELLASKLIVKGVSDDSLSPDANITRAEFAALLIRGLGLSPTEGATKFKDVPKDAWFASTVNTAVNAKLVSGFEDQTFRPNASITREQMAVMLLRAIEYTGRPMKLEGKDATKVLAPFTDKNKVSSWSKDALAVLIDAKLITGTSATTVAPTNKATRAQSTVIVSRFLKYVDFIND